MKGRSAFAWRFVANFILSLGGLLVLCGGSLLTMWLLLAPQSDIYSVQTQRVEAFGWAVAVAWPVTLLIFWLLTSLSLVVIGQAREIGWLLALIFMAGVSVFLVMGVVQIFDGASTEHRPARFAGSITIVLVDLAAVQSWRHNILTGDTPMK